ncbi:hypothetical protein HDU80_004414 [Chytriomyces hyalinus]|nr:hypothetical protein HDU80_004414 [Chytriomyces hyalinus]
MQDPIISQMLQHRPAMDDVPPDAEEERRRRMFVMLRWSNRYKKLQVEDANAKWLEQGEDGDNDQQRTAEQQDPFAALEPSHAPRRPSKHDISQQQQQSSSIQLDDIDLLDLEMASSSSSSDADDDDDEPEQLVEKTATGPIYAPETRRNSLDMKTCLKSAKTATTPHQSSNNPQSSPFKYLPPLQMRPLHTTPNASNQQQQQFVPQQSYASLQPDGSGYLTPPPEPPPTQQQHLASSTASVPSASSSPRRVSFSTEVRTFLLQAQLSNDSVHRMDAE